MTPLQAMLASISSIAISVWFVFLIGRYSVHKRNPGRSYLAQTVSKISLGSYMFWTTIGLFATIYNRLITKPIKYLRTPRNVIGVGRVRPLEETWFCLQLVFWYLTGLIGYPFIRLYIAVSLLYYRNFHPTCSKMTYIYDSWAQRHYWIPVNNGWTIERGEWVRDITISPGIEYLKRSGNSPLGGMTYWFVIPYCTLGYLSMDKLEYKEKTIIYIKGTGDLHANDPKSNQPPT